MAGVSTPQPGASRIHLAALAASRFGLLRAVRQTRRLAPGGRALVALAYHRIGDRAGCPVDENLFSVSAAELAAQVRMLQRWTRIGALEDVEAAYDAGGRFREPLALLTFDDTYADNYREAFPVLKQAGVSGVFFCPTGLIEQRHVPFWDRIAYAVKRSQVDECRLTYPDDVHLTDIRSRPRDAVVLLQKRYKRDAGLDKDRFVGAVEAATGARAADSPEVGELFARWSELREMAADGMQIASHTHTHRLLGHLPYAEQYEELERSRAVLKERLGVETRAIAYPVGKRTHFNADTRRALAELGYRLGFSHYNGWNAAPSDRYDIRRIRIEPRVTPPVLEAALALPSLFATEDAG